MHLPTRRSHLHLPDFLIIGAMKAGTTTLFRDLQSVDGIFMPTVKEPACLAHDHVLSAPGLRQYMSHYRCGEQHSRKGDASTDYSKLPDFPGVAARAKAVLGNDIQIVYLVRDPIERLISHHRHEYSRGMMPRDIQRAVEQHSRLVDYGRYRMQLEPWLSDFGNANVMVVAFRRYMANRRDVLNEILQFLGLERLSDQVAVSGVYNAAAPRISARNPLSRIARAPTYLRYIRPFVPGRLRRVARQSVSLDLPPPTNMSMELRNDLIQIFEPDLRWLKSLGTELDFESSG